MIIAEVFYAEINQFADGGGLFCGFVLYPFLQGAEA